MHDEHKLGDLSRDGKGRELEDSFKSGEPIRSPIIVKVNYKGDAYVAEGNHRLHVGLKNGLKVAPVRVKYYIGAEKLADAKLPFKEFK
jgi:hypothetical protein